MEFLLSENFSASQSISTLSWAGCGARWPCFWCISSRLLRIQNCQSLLQSVRQKPLVGSLDFCKFIRVQSEGSFCVNPGLDCDGLDTVEMSCIVAITRTLSSNDDSGVKAASKVVHAHPASPQAWTALVENASLSLNVITIIFSKRSILKVFAMFSRPSKFTSETLRRTISKAEALLAEGTGHEKVKLWLDNYKSAMDSVIST